MITPNRTPWRAWPIWFLGALFFFYEFCIQVSAATMTGDLMKTFAVGAEAVGGLIGSYLMTYAAIQLLVGLLVDRFGPRRLATFACCLCALGCLFFGSAQSLATAKLGRMMIGLGSAFALVSSFKLTANWFPPNRFAFMTSLVVTIGMLGAIAGEAPFARMVHLMGWRQVMSAMGYVGLILAVAIFLVVRDRPGRSEGVPESSSSVEELPILKGLLNVIRNPQSWWVSIYGALMYAPTPAFSGLWGPDFLRTNYHFSQEEAAGYASLVYVGWALGSPFFGWLSDRLSRRKISMWVGAWGALVMMVSLVFLSDLPRGVLITLLVGLGFTSSGFLPCFSLMREINPNRVSGTAIGFSNMLNSLGGAVMQPLVGFAVDHFLRASHAQAGAYTADHYRLGLQILVMCFVGALLFLPFIHETYGKTREF